MWIAGIWEENGELGRCYSMITTEANSLMRPIHDRMPAVLDPSQQAEYLAGDLEIFNPRPGLLEVADAPNPLTRKPQQDELF